MSASLHIHGTGSSILDSVFVCRSHHERPVEQAVPIDDEAFADVCSEVLARDAVEMREGGVKIREGDLRCLLAGHVARFAVNALRDVWIASDPIATRMAIARALLEEMTGRLDVGTLVARVLHGEGAKVEANAATV